MNKLTEKELLIVKDTQFLLTKARIIEEINSLLVYTRSELIETVKNNSFRFPPEVNLDSGKISRGENYLNLPYLVLDYPGLFTQTNTFAFRTMFWWGNFFSATLHLQGNLLNNYRDSVIKNLDKLKSRIVFICVGDTPWQYHYEKDNYVLLADNHIDHIKNCEFLKLSKRIELDDWQSVPETTKNYFNFLIQVLNNNNGEILK